MREIDKELGDYRVLTYTPTSFTATETRSSNLVGKRSSRIIGERGAGGRSKEALARKAAVQREVRKKNREARTWHPDGYWFHEDADHGTWNGLNTYGCRCPDCTSVGKKKEDNGAA